VRTSFFSLAALCLVLTGCSNGSLFKRSNGSTGSGGLFSKREPSSRSGDTGASSSPDNGSSEVSGTLSSLPPNVNGFLSGTVVDPNNRRVANVKIEVVDMDDKSDKPPLHRTATADNQGYFRLAGLAPTHKYLLIARTTDAGRQLAGRVRVIPPNPKVVLPMSEDGVAPAGNIERAPAPDRTAEAPQGGQSKPVSSIPAPVNPPPSPPTPGPNPERTATGNASDHQFAPAPRSSPANISGPGREPAPSPRPDASRRLDLPPAPTPALSIPGPVGPMGAGFDRPHPVAPAVRNEVAVVPSCVREGNKVYNLALYDTDGGVWELRKNRKRLVLVDFWKTNCPPCLSAIPKLASWNSKYGTFGFSVVGIAYEDSGTSTTQQAEKIRGLRGRLGINYPTLLGSGANCPVKKQFEVSMLPTLVLIDESGTIVWQSEGGLERYKEYELEMAIRQKLGFRD
jgi:thiol-disulfide isomerase/thioredoxin